MRTTLMCILLMTGVLSAQIAAPPLSPEEALRSFQIVEGFTIDLVAHEPMVQDPVAFTFGPDGRMWVVEMRGFMPDVAGRGESEPNGRISVLEDADGDGRMDRSVVFMDGLVLPRAIALVEDGVLVADARTLRFVRDTDGDGKADVQEIVDPDYAGPGSPEHQANGLLQAIDNWIYSAKSGTRYRRIDGQWVRQSIISRGQWGISQDDFGRLYYNFNFDQLRCDLVPPGYLLRNPSHRPATGANVSIVATQRLFPIRSTPAINRGDMPEAFDEHGRLKQFTAACAPLLFRGTALGDDIAGRSAFVCDPCGHLIKHNRISDDGVTVVASDAYEGREILASTDERFRPVFLGSGPDGTLYIADMYRGVVQHAQHMTPYLREISLQRGLEQPVHLGRIYRVRRTGVAAKSSRSNLAQMSTAELIDQLRSPDGWYRDTAHRLLAERGDPAALPLLRDLARRGEWPATRAHALWVLEAMHDPQPLQLLDTLNDRHPRVQAAAMRVVESLTRGRSEAHSFADRIIESAASWPAAAQLQAVLTLGETQTPRALQAIAQLAAMNIETPVFRDAAMSSIAGRELQLLHALLSRPDWQAQTVGRSALFESLGTALWRRGDPATISETLARVGAFEAWTWRERAVIGGMAMQARAARAVPIRLGAPPPLASAPRTDRMVQSLHAALIWPGHQPPPTAASTARPLTESEEQRIAAGRQLYVNICAGCHGLEGQGVEPLAPPLVDSPLVLGSADHGIRILLHGITGPLKLGEIEYHPPRVLPEMPPVTLPSDADVAAVLSYIRRAWGHEAEPVTPRRVQELRYFHSGRTRPWTQQELEAISPPGAQR